MKAFLKNHNQSPRKTRLVADMIRGKSVERARRVLAFADKKSALAVGKLLESAVSNARATGMDAHDLFVKEILVDQGLVMRRMEPKARGQGAIIRHRLSRVSLTLGTMERKTSVREAATEKPSAKKSAAKKTAVNKTTAKKTAKKAAK